MQCMHRQHPFLSLAWNAIFSFTAFSEVPFAHQPGLSWCTSISPQLSSHHPVIQSSFFFPFCFSESTRRTWSSAHLNCLIFPSQFLAVGLSYGCRFSSTDSDGGKNLPPVEGWVIKMIYTHHAFIPLKFTVCHADPNCKCLARKLNPL